MCIRDSALTDYSDLTAAMARLSPGDTTRLSWLDPSGTSQTATVTLGRAPLA